jgi:simple sugar transport system permease protein
LTEQTKSLGAEILREAAPEPSPRQSFWRRVLDVAALPALALITALAVGALIIAASDLTVLAELSGTLSRLAPPGYVRLALALAALVGAGWLYGNVEGVLARALRRPATARETVLIRGVVAVGGLLLTYALLRSAGLGGMFDAAFRAVSTAYGAMVEGSLGSLPAMIAAVQSGEQAAILRAFYPILESLVAATPYIFAGLAVAVGFRCGLFNIGAEGQLYIGAICSAFVGYSLHGLPAIIHVPLALLAGALGGAAWAFVPAILKAKVGAHEVINTIMMNYIAFRLSEWLLTGPMKRPDSANPVSPTIEASAMLPRFFPDPIRFHLGFFIALAMAALVYWLLFRTTLGFEVRTVGASPNAARYSGMSITRNFIIALCFSGALAGLAGANEVLGVNHNLALAFSSGYGFDSIALALLGKSHPFGVVLAALLFGTLSSGGTRMQNIAKIPVDIISVVQALVIAFVAAPAIIRAIYRIPAKSDEQAVFSRGWGK